MYKHANTHHYTSHLYTAAASLIVLTCNPAVHFLFALFVSRSGFEWSAQAFERSGESYEQTPAADFTCVLLRRSAVRRMWACL